MQGKATLDLAALRSQSAAMTRLTIRIDFGDAAAFGPGKARLLELVDETGSIRRAAAAMDMSYRQAWLLVQAVEATFGGTVVETARGGAGGGGARLTDLGRTLLTRYRTLEAKAAQAAAADMAALVRLTRSPASQKRRSIRPRRTRGKPA